MENKKEISEKIKEAISVIEKNNNILILSHEKPDGDSVGSSLALSEALLQKGKRPVVFIPGGVPEKFNFLSYNQKIYDKISPSLFDLAIFLDIGSLTRNPLYEEIKKLNIPIINIDHHLQESKEGRVAIIDNSFSATAEIIYFLLEEMGVKIEKGIALALLTGIFTDTGGFQHATTTNLSFQIASNLLLKGARLDKVSKLTNSDKNLATLKIWGRAILKAKKDPFSKAVVSYINKKDLEVVGASLEDLSGVVNLINSVNDAKFTLLLTEYEQDKVKGTLRGNYFEGVNVKEIAEKYGGGGHPFASGFEVKGRVKESRRGWKIIIKNEKINSRARE